MEILKIIEEYKIRGKVDKDACIGCGLCAAICQKIFIMDDDGKAVAKEIDIDQNNIAGAKEILLTL